MEGKEEVSELTDLFRMQNGHRESDNFNMIRCPKCGCPHLPNWKKKKLMGVEYSVAMPVCVDCGYRAEDVAEFVDWTIKVGCLTVLEEKAL